MRRLAVIKGLSRRRRRIALTLAISGSLALIVGALVIFQDSPEPYTPGEKIEGVTDALARSLPSDYPRVTFVDVSADAGIVFKHFSETGPAPQPLKDIIALLAEAPEPEVKVEFDQTGADIQPPPMKRVQVSNQLDILAELDGLRKQATMKPEAKKTAQDQDKNLDLDSLLGNGPKTIKSHKVHQRVEESMPSDVLAKMQVLQMAIRIQNGNGETIHTLNPIAIEVKDSSGKVSVQLSLDLTPDN